MATTQHSLWETQSTCEYTVVRTLGNLSEMFRVLAHSPLLGIDLETSELNPWTAKQLLWQISDGTKTYVGLSHLIPLHLLAPLLTTHTLIAHNAAMEWKHLAANGVVLGGMIDTQVAYIVCKAGLFSRKEASAYSMSKLSTLAQNLLGITLHKDIRSEFIEKDDDEFTEEQMQYAAMDAKILVPLWNLLRQELVAKELLSTAEREFACIPVSAGMEMTGAVVDRKAWIDYVGSPSDTEERKTLYGEQVRLQNICQPLANKAIVAERAQNPFEKVGKASVIKKGGGGQQGLLFTDIIRDVDLTSSQQMLNVYKAYGLEPENTESDVLEQLLVTRLPRDARTLIESMIKLSEVRKLTSTYGLNVVERLTDEDVLYASFFQLGASSTGRYSSNNPNLMNIPARGKHGKAYRSFFIARPGEKLVIADYSALEQRIPAHTSGDPTMQSIFHEGKDMHGVSAAGIFKLNYTEMEKAGQYDRETGEWARKDAGYDTEAKRWVRKDGQQWVDALTEEPLNGVGKEVLTIKYMRDEITKICSFASNYGGGASTIQRTLRKHITFCKEVLGNYTNTYQKMFAYMAREGHRAKTAGFTTNILGRKRFYWGNPEWDPPSLFPTWKMKKTRIYEEALASGMSREEADKRVGSALNSIERQGKNAPTQSLAADIMKEAMVRVDRELKERQLWKSWGPKGRTIGADGPGAAIIIQVHDEIVLRADEEIVDTVSEIVSRRMLEVEAEIIPSVPPGVSVYVGDDWSAK